MTPAATSLDDKSLSVLLWYTETPMRCITLLVNHSLSHSLGHAPVAHIYEH
jgi:hypothetical protein